MPWQHAADDDGTFKSVENLSATYGGELSLQPDDDIIVYCRIGERRASGPGLRGIRVTSRQSV
jgi:3-mercaptopyruvate sulfurtransferase SseA